MLFRSLPYSMITLFRKSSLASASSNSVRWLIVAFFGWCLVATAQAVAVDNDFFSAEAKAVSAAVAAVSDSVVQVEVIGVAETPGGEVAADAPTSATIIDSEGYLLATSQVTARPSASILVVLQDGTRLPAQVVAEDKGRELVLLKVQPESPLTAIDFVPAEDTRVGQYAIAVGRLLPDGPPAKSVGIVSALSRLDGRALQTDARISPPFYGGPLVNIRGQILGIVVPAMPEMGGTGDKSGWYDSGIAFVAPADQILSRLEKLKSGESIRPGKLGIVAGSQDPLADGTTISAVRIGSPAAAVEMQPGDVIKSVNSQPVSRHADIKQALGSIDAGTEITVEVIRDGQTITLNPTLVAEIPPFDPQTFGFLIDDRDNDLRTSAVFPGSAAERAGLRVDDRILSVAGKSVKELADLRNRVMTLLGGKEVSIEVQRGEETVTLKATPESIASVWPFELPVLPQGVELQPEESAADEAAADDKTANDEKTDSGEWTIGELTLPDVANKAAMVAPPESQNTVPQAVLVLFTEPGTKDIQKYAEKWKAIASQLHVIVVVVGSADAERWNPDEADIGARLVAVVRNRYRIQPFAIAVTGEGAGAGLAMIAAFKDPSTFSGMIIPSDVKPPAIQLRENDPSSPLHLMLKKVSDIPPWAEVLRKSGYAVIESESGDEGMLKFTWGMGRI